jgi:hypothetical protein
MVDLVHEKLDPVVESPMVTWVLVAVKVAFAPVIVMPPAANAWPATSATTAAVAPPTNNVRTKRMARSLACPTETRNGYGAFSSPTPISGSVFVTTC